MVEDMWCAPLFEKRGRGEEAESNPHNLVDKYASDVMMLT
jgi:hypothetical protein